MGKQDCLIAFGSNLGESDRTLQKVIDHFRSHPKISHVIVSQAILTPAVGGPGNQSPYLNACLRFECWLPVSQLMELLSTMEKELGRERKERWASRAIDLDLLLFGQEIIDESNGRIIVPHPRMNFRRFVLQPANDIAPNMVHPRTGCKLSEMLARLDSAENRVGFVSTSNGNVVELAQSMRAVCEFHGFRFNHFVRILNPNSNLGAFKFVVYLKRDCEDLVHRIQEYSGPLLRLDSEDPKSVVSELTAAIAATRPF